MTHSKSLLSYLFFFVTIVLSWSNLSLAGGSESGEEEPLTRARPDFYYTTLIDEPADFLFGVLYDVGAYTTPKPKLLTRFLNFITNRTPVAKEPSVVQSSEIKCTFVDDEKWSCTVLAHKERRWLSDETSQELMRTIRYQSEFLGGTVVSMTASCRKGRGIYRSECPCFIQKW